MFVKKIIVSLFVVFIFSFSLGYLGSIAFLKEMNQNIQVKEDIEIQNKNIILNSDNFIKKDTLSSMMANIAPAVIVDNNGELKFLN